MMYAGGIQTSPPHPDPRCLIGARLAAGVRPQSRIAFSRWIGENIILVDGPNAGEPWQASGAPYLLEIADCLSDDDPCNLVTVRKSQQSGASILALAWCLFIADREPSNILYGIPGIDALRDLNSAKLQPLIEAWHRRIKRTVIVPQTSRSGTGSTTYEKVFSGGRLFLANANSVMDLSAKTVRKGVKDELSKWQDIPGWGNPEDLFFGRFTSFRRTRGWKILEISTPEIDSGDELAEAEEHCRIDRSFRRSDQRYWNCLCPECGSFFVHSFDRLRIDQEHAHRTAYECQCGHLISEAERVVGTRAGHWRATRMEPGRHPGFHIDAFCSLMMSYEAIAEDWIKAKTETEKKAFHNLVLGLPYRFKADVPDHEKLLGRVERHLTRGQVPPRGLLLTAFADVQMRGIWLEIVAFAPNRESWCIDAVYIDGDTSDPRGPVFEQLRRETINREFPDAFGRTRRIDALGIDSGFRANVVYAFVRNSQRANSDTGRDLILATKGLTGWGRPALGQPTLVDIDLGGQRIKQGAKVWGIGTWPMKVSAYSDLRLEFPPAPQEPIAPAGYCHFGPWCDEVYFKQLTGEQLEDVKFRGKTTGRRWVKHRDNHFLDCRVGNMALADYLGLQSTAPEEWAALARLRGLPEELSKVELFSSRPAAAALAPAEGERIAAAKREAAKSTGEASRRPWIAPRGGSWLRH